MKFILYKIKESGDNSPLHAFFSGKGAPSIKNKTSIYNESDEVIIKEIYDLGGTPKELLNQKEILNIFLKIIRADYEIIETYEYIEKKEKLDFPISVFYGADDKLTIDNLKLWENVTNSGFEKVRFNGGHFFINHYIYSIRIL